MIKKTIDHLDLKQIADSGQCFRWELIEKDDQGGMTYIIPSFGRKLVATQHGNEFIFDCDENEWDEIWAEYFDMDTDYAAIEKLIAECGDQHEKEAFAEGAGIRILRQETWEMIISFMISQNNNIPRIRNSIKEICVRTGAGYGEAFPSVDEMDKEMFLDKTLGLGYRNTYIMEMIDFIRENPNWIDDLKTMSYDEAFEELVKRKGIGKKVASCICLFGLHHVEAFPIDTHVKQLLEKYYPDGFDFEKYEGVAGIIQQYLFYYELNHKKG